MQLWALVPNRRMASTQRAVEKTSEHVPNLERGTAGHRLLLLPTMQLLRRQTERKRDKRPDARAHEQRSGGHAADRLATRDRLGGTRTPCYKQCEPYEWSAARDNMGREA